MPSIGSNTARGMPPKKRSGDTYSPRSRTPRCTHRPSQCPPVPTTPIGAPGATDWPVTTEASTGSTVDTSPSACVMLTTARSTTRPANDTLPAATATTC
ncbi:hypothetical protein ACVLV4_000631 [Rathayibacter agropyri]